MISNFYKLSPGMEKADARFLTYNRVSIFSLHLHNLNIIFLVNFILESYPQPDHDWGGWGVFSTTSLLCFLLNNLKMDYIRTVNFFTFQHHSFF